jgi:formylmethanofuran dehydrogenase subunit D
VEKSKLRMILLTGRTREQGVAKERGKASKEYLESVSVCYIDPKDLKKLGVKDKTNVLVSTDYGSVIVKALKSPRAPHPGVIFVPYGPWANALTDPETHGVGMPSFKGIPVELEPALDKAVLSLAELLKAQFGKD